VIKCDEADQNFNRLRNCINYGEIENAERIISDLQAQNNSSLNELQNEISDGPNLIQIVGNLTTMLAKELSRARSSGRKQPVNESYDDFSRGGHERSHSPLRSALKNQNTSSGGIRRDLMD